MKNFYSHYSIAFLALLFTPAIFYSQVNSYFLNDPVWKVWSGNTEAGCDYKCVRKEVYNYYINGDTIIKSLTYKKVFKKGQGHFTDQYGGAYTYQSSMNTSPYHYIHAKPQCLLRSAGKQMYLRYLNDTIERLLYDFDLAVGDTLPKTFNNLETNTKVTGIDSVYTPYGYRRKFSVNSANQFILEGVGHGGGLLEPMGSVLGYGSGLDCFSLNNAAYFPSSGPTCNIAVGISAFEKPQTLSVFPNPFVNFTILQFNSFLNDAELNIYNHCGQRVRNMNNISGDKVEIERGVLPAGLYLYELMQSNGAIANGKLLIVD